MELWQQYDRTAIRIWAVAAVIGAGLVLFAYVAVQQAVRLGLNDPQTQIAQDTARQLTQGAAPSAVIPRTIVDESTSLAPFVTIVDKAVHVQASSGRIGGVVPLPPVSAFPDSQKRGSNWFTWQHDDNQVRDAAVIIPYGGSHPGYVLVARSMKQVENTLEHITLLAGLTLLGVVVAPAIVLRVLK